MRSKAKTAQREQEWRDDRHDFLVFAGRKARTHNVMLL